MASRRRCARQAAIRRWATASGGAGGLRCACWVAGKPLKHITQVDPGIVSVDLCRLHQAHDDRCALAGQPTAAGQPCLPAHCHRRFIQPMSGMKSRTSIAGTRCFDRRVRRPRSERRATGEVVHAEVEPGVVVAVAGWMFDAASCAHAFSCRSTMMSNTELRPATFCGARRSSTCGSLRRPSFRSAWRAIGKTDVCCQQLLDLQGHALQVRDYARTRHKSPESRRGLRSLVCLSYTARGSSGAPCL